MNVSMTPAQTRCFEELLAIGGPRPVSPPDLAMRLRAVLEAGTEGALREWSERTLWFGKSQLGAVTRCEGNAVAQKLRGADRRVTAPIATGQITHRAIQLSHTHKGRSVEEYVKLAIAGCMSEEGFAAFWDAAGEQAQSDCTTQAVSRTCAFMDTFPPLDARWTPRFEESTQARVGRLTLAARPDLVLGRPRGDGKQTMFLCDFKSGELREEHLQEARYYALVSTLRHGCAPYRSTVLSLASGEWTIPDVTAEILLETAETVARAVRAHVEVLMGQREAALTAGGQCQWCPARSECSEHAEWVAAGRPERVEIGNAVTVSVTGAQGRVPRGEIVLTGQTSGGAQARASMVLAGALEDPFAL